MAMTKPINSAQHAVIDYATAGAFIAAAGYYRNRHPEASKLALVNAAAIVALSVFTDYPGGVIRRLSFQTHGIIDSVLAVLCASGPAMFGFADDPEAMTFYGQAAAETAVISATDFSRA
jgi:hypothetical protein